MEIEWSGAWQAPVQINEKGKKMILRTRNAVVRSGPAGSLLPGATFQSRRFYFKVEVDGQAFSFFIATEPEAWQPVAEGVDGHFLSTPCAGGFVGTYIGMYASSNGQPSTNTADFDWFEYVGLDDK